MTDLYSLLDEVRAIAQNGLRFSSNSYDRERYEKLLQLASRSYGELLQVPEGEIRARFLSETGTITPKVGADAAIFNQRGEILLMERVDGSGWCLPCGWVEPNEKPAEAAIRGTLSHEGLALRYWPIDQVENWHATHRRYAREAHRIWRSKAWLPAVSD